MKFFSVRLGLQLALALTSSIAAPGQTAAGGTPPADRPTNLALMGR